MLMGMDGIFIILTMSIYYQVLAFRHILIELDDTATLTFDPQEIKLKMFEYGTTAPSFTTKFNPQLKQNRLIWQETVDYRFTGQKKLAFQVYCPPQELQNTSTQIIFKGTYYVDTEISPKKDSAHIYSVQGEKQGLIRWQVSLQKRQEIIVRQEQPKIEKPLIPQHLIGVIKISEASFSVTNSIFNKKKHPNPTLILTFGSQTSSSDCVQDYRWRFQDIKIQYFPQSSQAIELQIFQEGLSLLNGSISCESIRKMKRYLRQEVSMFNKNQIKVGTVALELRYMDKQELIVFVYSPQNNPNFTKRYSPTTILPTIPFKSSLSRQQIMKKNRSFLKESPSKQMPNRYALQHSDVLLPKTLRFMTSKPNNAYASYLDPEKMSPFSAQRRRGWDMSLGRKLAFTREYRGNPGVGTQKMPSIWGEH